MAKFIDALCITEIDDSIFAVFDHPFRYQSDLIPDLITVPVGFHTDFASVPRIGIIYAVLGDTAHEPAVVHDWLYYAGITTREMADHILMEAMVTFGIAPWRRWSIYWGVRLGGWYAWNDHRKRCNPKDRKFKGTPNIGR